MPGIAPIVRPRPVRDVVPNFRPAMSDIVTITLPFFGLIALGYGAGHWRKTPVEGLAWLNFFVFYLALPALFFQLIAETPIVKLTSWSFVLTTIFGTYCAFAIAFSIAALTNRGNVPAGHNSGARRILFQQRLHGAGPHSRGVRYGGRGADGARLQLRKRDAVHARSADDGPRPSRPSRSAGASEHRSHGLSSSTRSSSRSFSASPHRPLASVRRRPSMRSCRFCVPQQRPARFSRLASDWGYDRKSAWASTFRYSSRSS